MRLLLDINILLDCLILEKSGSSRPGAPESGKILELCDQGRHDGLVAWHTLPTVYYYHGRQNPAPDTAAMIDELLYFLQVPTTGHADALNWRQTGVVDFEDALQVTAALSGGADYIITRNVMDFTRSIVPALTPERFLATHP